MQMPAGSRLKRVFVEITTANSPTVEPWTLSAIFLSTYIDLARHSALLKSREAEIRRSPCGCSCDSSCLDIWRFLLDLT